MTKFLKIFIIVLSVMSVSSLAAQEKSNIAYDFDLAIDSTGWRYSNNASQLYRMPVNAAGRALVGYNQQNGNSLPYNRAETTRDYMLFSEAYYRLSPAAMLYGQASFSGGTETNVVGSAFLNAKEMPFDITFMDETNTGDRKIERYNILGAIGYNVIKGLAIGAKFDYTAINMARTRDLRHTNKILSMNASGGLSYVFSKNFTLGAHYTYQRYIESVNFNIYGTTDKQYFNLINYGAFCGTQELFDSNGYARKGTNTPFVENIHQAGFQLDWKIGSFRIFNEMMWADLSGYYGKKGTSNVQFTTHSGNLFNERLSLVYTGRRTYQSLTFGLRSRKLENYEKLWRSETGANGNSVTKYYGQNLVGEKKLTTLDAQYFIGWGDISNAPQWALKISSQMDERDITGVLYPYYRKQKLNMYQQRLDAMHQFNAGKFNLMFNVHAAYRTGSGDKALDGVYVTPSSDAGSLRYQNEFLNREYNYLTSDRFVPGVEMRVTFPVKSIGCFVQFDYENEIFISGNMSEKNIQNFGVRAGINF